MAPEVLAQPSAHEAAQLPPGLLASYDEKVDCWAVGVLVGGGDNGPFAARGRCRVSTLGVGWRALRGCQLAWVEALPIAALH